jgi:hypothetical protein
MFNGMLSQRKSLFLLKESYMRHLRLYLLRASI